VLSTTTLSDAGYNNPMQTEPEQTHIFEDIGLKTPTATICSLITNKACWCPLSALSCQQPCMTASDGETTTRIRPIPSTWWRQCICKLHPEHIWLQAVAQHCMSSLAYAHVASHAQCRNSNGLLTCIFPADPHKWHNSQNIRVTTIGYYLKHALS
jgi:hypothetical protein